MGIDPVSETMGLFSLFYLTMGIDPVSETMGLKLDLFPLLSKREGKQICF
jgi:hypothetical protein